MSESAFGNRVSLNPVHREPVPRGCRAELHRPCRMALQRSRPLAVEGAPGNISTYRRGFSHNSYKGQQ